MPIDLPQFDSPQVNSYLVDSHCHLDFPDFEGKLPELRAAMKANGVTHALCISTTVTGFPRVREIASLHDNFWCSVGVHPDTEGEEEATQAELVFLGLDDEERGCFAPPHSCCPRGLQAAGYSHACSPRGHFARDEGGESQ